MNSEILDQFPKLKPVFENEFKETKKMNSFQKISQISASNIQQTYEMLLELFMRDLFLYEIEVLYDFVQMGFM